MENIFKTYKSWIINLGIILFSFTSFAQTYSDETIGFDTVKVSAILKSHGISDKDLNYELTIAREHFTLLYRMQKNELDKIQQGQKTKQNLSTANSKTMRTLAVPDIPQSEKNALLDLYNSTNGDNWTDKTGWDFNTPVTSNWYGVTVSSDNHVINLTIQTNNLQGPLPESIGNLTQLKSLFLGANKITGTIPTSIANLSNLTVISLNINQLTGGIPFDNANLPNLKTLYLYSNKLNGNISANIGNLQSLETLAVDMNELTGTIPKSIGNLTKLSQFSLNFNQLTGEIPKEIGNASALEYIQISSNKLTGKIPVEIKKLALLNNLHLGNNELSDLIPPEISLLSNLKSFDISRNNFRFVDFANEYPLYKSRPNFSFYYNSQKNIDNTATITAGIGTSATLTMFEDGRTAGTDAFQWYKNGAAISGATSRIYTIPNVQAVNAGSYYCIAKNTVITDLTLTRNTIQLVTAACTNVSGAINSSLEKFCITEPSTFSFQTSNTNLKYKWSVTTAENVEIDSKSDDVTGNYAYTFSNPGSYIIKTEVTNQAGCITNFTKPITVIDCQTFCVNRPINLSFETTAKNISYKWYTVKNGTTQQLNPITNTTGSYSFTPPNSGSYTIHLNAYYNNECTFEFTKNVTVEKCEDFISCTKNNPNTPNIKAIFKTLANKLVNLPAETIKNGYTCDELKALAFYIKDENPAIYNFVHNTQQGFIAFSFSEHTDYDVKIATNGNSIADFNLDDYESNEIVTKLIAPSGHIDTYINHIDFCSELYCVNHVAFVLDESGSIDLTEAIKIKKQLKKYIQQQANDNDKLQSNIYVSLTGMSDSDSVTREDNIKPTRLSNTDPATLKKFNNWIDNYRTRNGTGISSSSDYWKTALDVTLNSSIKPNVVIMITDGCETSNVEALRDQTMARFSNSKSTLFTNPDKPHLYVVGIENGFYVDGGITGVASLARNEDPNYVQSLTASNNESRVVPVLRTSLKYLLSLGEKEYPESKINDFRYDYYGYENFDPLGTLENEAFFSDNLKLSKFTCGDPTDKNYCSDCLSFQPIPGKEYLLSAWVKEESALQVKTYENAVINVIFYNSADTDDVRNRIGTEKLVAKGDIIDGWQRITSKFLIPNLTKAIGIELENLSNGLPVYFDDIRVHPLDGSVKTFVYDSETFKLMSELDENNYSTFYEYDNEGGLVRIKKETAKGVKTIQETRSGTIINN
ncbi:VWA domain-containing protein [Flavobacterium sp. FlaQc-48]|uniref:leucine-rich repeat domain-containing protein n=1 Tax=Flavobacterium sp. FlaQc-48 TaxID=3374181 RepID=UPI00375816C5